jgi:hypothetical protein
MAWGIKKKDSNKNARQEPASKAKPGSAPTVKKSRLGRGSNVVRTNVVTGSSLVRVTVSAAGFRARDE